MAYAARKEQEWSYTKQATDNQSSDPAAFRHRSYSPTLMRWMEEDPLGYPDGMNSYQALSSNPLSTLDPMGTRDLTQKEQQLLTSVEQLSEKAEGEELKKAISSVVTDIKGFIADVKTPEDPAFLKTGIGALKIWADHHGATSQYLPDNAPGKWKGQNQCNRYVADVLASVKIDASIGTWKGNRSPIAGEWADPTLLGSFKVVWEINSVASKEGGKLVFKLEYPLKGQLGSREGKLGDIVTHGPATSAGSGAHVGIFLGHGIYVSATASSIAGQQGVVIKGVNNTKRQLYRSPPEK